MVRRSLKKKREEDDETEPMLGRPIPKKSRSKKAKPTKTKVADSKETVAKGKKRKSSEIQKPEMKLQMPSSDSDEDEKPKHESAEFREVIKEMLKNQLPEDIDFDDAAVDTMQRAWEDYMETLFAQAHERAQSNKRKTISPEDIRAVAEELNAKRKKVASPKKEAKPKKEKAAATPKPTKRQTKTKK